MRVAVVTEALSSKFFFPLWYRYYARQFGQAALYVVSPAGAEDEFSAFTLGGVITLPRLEIDEARRSKTISNFVRGLLGYYDFVLRVDTDEFLVADPRKFPSLSAYVDQLELPYVTALGIDVFQHPEEPTFDPDRGLLIEQRRFGYLTSSMSKTSITSVAVDWGPGFHFCTLYPRFDDLFLFHLKRLDIEMQIAWFSEISGFDFRDKNMVNYYAPDIDKIRNFHGHTSRRPVVDGWDALDDVSFRDRFFEAVKLDKSSGIYRGAHFAQDTIVRLPKELQGHL